VKKAKNEREALQRNGNFDPEERENCSATILSINFHFDVDHQATN